MQTARKHLIERVHVDVLVASLDHNMRVQLDVLASLDHNLRGPRFVKQNKLPRKTAVEDASAVLADRADAGNGATIRLTESVLARNMTPQQHQQKRAYDRAYYVKRSFTAAQKETRNAKEREWRATAT